MKPYFTVSIAPSGGVIAGAAPPPCGVHVAPRTTLA